MKKPQYKKAHTILIRLYFCLDRFKTKWTTRNDLVELYRGLLYTQRLASYVEERDEIERVIDQALDSVRSIQLRHYDHFVWAIEPEEHDHIHATYNYLGALLDVSQDDELESAWLAVQHADLPVLEFS